MPRLPSARGHAAIPAQPVEGRRPQGLDRFNSQSAKAAQSALLGCLASPRWARRLTRHRPYPDLGALHAAADEASYDLGHAEIGAALAREPRTALPPHTGHLAARIALTAAYAAYEARFGHAFVMYLAEFPADEVLDQVLHGIRSRLGNDPEDERVVAAEELRRLARGRITLLVSAAGEAQGRPVSPKTGRPDSPYVPV